MNRAQLAYRPCVGIAVFNGEGLVLLGRRDRGNDEADQRYAWQMPQGGIDRDEKPVDAAIRELYEETNIRSVSLLGETTEWLNYDLPPRARGSWKGRYCGQTQKWFAFRFEGDESEIDVQRPAGGAHKPEFNEWRWERLDRIPELIIPFKRDVYEHVVKDFARFAVSAPGRGDGGEP